MLLYIVDLEVDQQYIPHSEQISLPGHVNMPQILDKYMKTEHDVL